MSKPIMGTPIYAIKFADGKGSNGKWVRSVTATRARDKDGGYHISVDGERRHFNYHHNAVIRLLAQVLEGEAPHLGSIRIRFTSARKPKALQRRASSLRQTQEKR